MQKYVIALYIRLSLEDYKYDSMSIENQHLVLNEFVSSMPESTDAEVLEFIDNGYSGTNFERPKVQELIELVRANQIDCIIVKDFSRFGRNSIETGYFIERVFPLFHTRFISINDDFDSDQHKGDTGGMDVAFKYLISEYYSRDMSMKTKSAKYAKMQRGEYQSKICPYGYRKSADGRMEPNPETAVVVQLIFQLAATGIGAAAITRELFKRGIPTPGEYKAAHGQQYHDVSRSRGRWSSSTVLRILEDERYIGSYVIGRRAVIEVGGTRSRMKDRDKWFIIPDHHPAIIEKELFEKVQAVQRRFSLPARKARAYPLKGKVLCCLIFTVPAYAQSNEPQPEAAPAPVETEAEPETQNPFTPDGTGTVVDNATDEDGKEFYTITTADESVFYLVIDKQKTSENVYFLNAVTVDDLLPLAEQGEEPAEEVTPEPEPEPTEPVEEVTEPEPEPEVEKTGSPLLSLLLIGAVVLIGGGAGYYFKIYKPKHEAPDLEDDYCEYEDEGPEEIAEEPEDEDTPPWDEDMEEQEAHQ